MMTSDPRAFVLDNARGEDTIREVLGQAYSVAEEHAATGSGARRRTWLDTFDWRLHGAFYFWCLNMSRPGAAAASSSPAPTVP